MDDQILIGPAGEYRQAGCRGEAGDSCYTRKRRLSAKRWTVIDEAIVSVVAGTTDRRGDWLRLTVTSGLFAISGAVSPAEARSLARSLEAAADRVSQTRRERAA